jgi:hypothetical protein
MNKYYANIEGNNEGPFVLDELKEMAKNCRIFPSTYVLLEGTQSWIAASEVQGLFPEQPQLPPLPSPAQPGSPQWSAEDTARLARQGADAAKQGAQMAIAYGATITDKSTGFWGGVITFIKRVLNEDTVSAAIVAISRAGIYAMVLAALSIVGAAVVGAIKFSEYQFLLVALLLVLSLSLVQYFATRFMGSGEKVISATPTHLGSDALPEALALVVFLLSLASLGFGISNTISTEAIWPLMVGAAIFLSGMLVVGISLNPSMLNIAVGQASSAGEEAIGLISFVYKSWLRAIPAIFGVLTTLGSLLLVWAFLKLLVGENLEGLAFVTSGIVMVFVGGLFPVLGLLIFLWIYLLIDVISAILSLPGKLDKLRK